MFSRLLNLIFPPKCIFCGGILDAGSDIFICDDCYLSIPFMKADYLGKSGNYCDSIICACEYAGVIKESLKRYKFYNKPGYYSTFGWILSEKIKKVTNFHKFDIIISVPLHKKREKTRGYNQSLLISRAVAKTLGIPECSWLLERVRDTHSQSLLGMHERHINIREAFRVTYASKVRDKEILLIDDILTTGSTVEECGRVLKECGAKHVTVAVIASGRKY